LQEYIPNDASVLLDGKNRFQSLDDCLEICEVQSGKRSYFHNIEGSGESSFGSSEDSSSNSWSFSQRKKWCRKFMKKFTKHLNKPIWRNIFKC